MRSLSVAVLGVVALAWPGGALAAEPPPVSSVGQYVETIPTSDGGIASGPRAEEQPLKPVPLAPPAREALEQRGGTDAKPLEALATRPEYGAPRAIPDTDTAATQSVDFAPLSAALSAAGDGAGNSLLPLFVGMALIALATVVAAGRAAR
jgi:hypothetical protein